MHQIRIIVDLKSNLNAVRLVIYNSMPTVHVVYVDIV